MRVVRVSLANFRVFPEVDIEVPPGVVGVYGPNGSGKSTLVEAILWALFGVARTAKESLRRDGAEGECRATVEFEQVHLAPATRAELRRDTFVAHVVFVLQDVVDNARIPINPLGMTITYFREDQAFQ